MTVLVIRRRHARRHRQRKYRVVVDGRQRAEVGDDETVQAPVTPGEHVVRVQVGLRGSRALKVEVAHGQIVRLECGPRAIPLLGLMYVIWRDDFISLETVTP
jgi:hypothetical protein